MPKEEPVVIPQDDANKILAAGADLLRRAPGLVDDNPQYAIGALSVALGTAAAMALVPYADLIDMVSRHYEQELLREVGDSLEPSEKLLPKSLDPQ